MWLVLEVWRYTKSQIEKKDLWDGVGIVAEVYLTLPWAKTIVKCRICQTVGSAWSLRFHKGALLHTDSGIAVAMIRAIVVLDAAPEESVMVSYKALPAT